ncbi:2,3-diaminopropionate biosynthesis protein SbnB [Actinomycetospora sp. NBRC 106378]|uniref:2,3-diaminopropionate biosynthesis protein SbnB n=1 Tax=Actinomycetospora sp. NBRC 106378 TaxID=3032208 RepID=UPI0024A0BE64|nr:2,3-diaminopropionate biosynthesis protein SbnB [Actinomycetospora sp. NBRC 106378]GLZ52636.1 2,3-diaminopropionate biosynthesis protein SbnB [Actinomycetospora sp. NBRC 106378]
MSTAAAPAAAPDAVPSGADGAPVFAVIPGAQVAGALHGRERAIVDVVEQAYRMHGAGLTSNPPSYFLRFPDKPNSRIIALPASVGGDVGVDGIKWVSSFPDNVAAGRPRASAVLILNDHATGYPFACLEASIINAVRTSASAALAADRLTAGRPRPRRVGFFGVGLIARYLHTYLAATGWEFDEVGVYDLNPESAVGFRGYLSAHDPATTVRIHPDAESLVRSSDLLVFATIAGEPHVHDPAWFDHHPLVLHVSLRDLDPVIVLGATNVVDDVDHCLRANTSLHLAEQQIGNRDFVDGTLDDVLTGRLTPPQNRTTVFSPFGLGILDLAVGKAVYDEIARSGSLQEIDGFFHEMQRYGTGPERR